MRGRVNQRPRIPGRTQLQRLSPRLPFAHCSRRNWRLAFTGSSTYTRHPTRKDASPCEAASRNAPCYRPPWPALHSPSARRPPAPTTPASRRPSRPRPCCRRLRPAYRSTRATTMPDTSSCGCSSTRRRCCSTRAARSSSGTVPGHHGKRSTAAALPARNSRKRRARAGSIPQLLLAATPAATDAKATAGSLAGVRFVQRLDTAGGMPPDAACSTEHAVGRFPYFARYVFLK